MLQLVGAPILTSTAAAEGEEQVKATLAGEIILIVPQGGPRSWDGLQPAELWLWDERKREASEKIADVEVSYRSGDRAGRGQFDGVYRTREPVALPPEARVVVRGAFVVSIRQIPRKIEFSSPPLLLPSPVKGEIKVPTFRRIINSWPRG